MPTTIQKFDEVRLTITDNAYKDGREGWPLEQCFECNSDLRLIKKQIVEDLSLIGGKKLSDIIDENPDILVFPYSLGGKTADMGDLKICSYNPAYDRLYTGNLMGFVGVNDTQLTIKSRFSSENEDYFLHYMLMKVFCPNVLKLEHVSDTHLRAHET